MNKEERDKKILDNQGLVQSIANHYTFCGIDRDDLVQEGFKGLIIAVDRYDENMGELAKYASFYIRKYMRLAVDKHVKVNENEVYSETIEKVEEKEKDNFDLLLKEIRKTNILTDKEVFILKSRIQLEATLQEIADELQLTKSRIQQIEKIILNKIEKELNL